MEGKIIKWNGPWTKFNATLIGNLELWFQEFDIYLNYNNIELANSNIILMRNNDVLSKNNEKNLKYTNYINNLQTRRVQTIQMLYR